MHVEVPMALTRSFGRASDRIPMRVKRSHRNRDARDSHLSAQSLEVFQRCGRFRNAQPSLSDPFNRGSALKQFRKSQATIPTAICPIAQTLRETSAASVTQSAWRDRVRCSSAVTNFSRFSGCAQPVQKLCNRSGKPPPIRRFRTHHDAAEVIRAPRTKRGDRTTNNNHPVEQSCLPESRSTCGIGAIILGIPPSCSAFLVARTNASM